MYGIVNRAIRDLVLSQAGPEHWSQICDQAGLIETDFSDTARYDDELSFELVAAASAVLGLTSEEILIRFGRHWILYTGKDGWGPLLDMAGDDLRSTVAGLDALHSRVQASMPGSRMPSFTSIDRGDGALEVEYRSDREGLIPMVQGLFEGLAERFGETWHVEHLGPRPDRTAEVFVLTPSTVVASEGEWVGAV